MAKGAWYLKRKGKFYGPFSPEKIKGFVDSGKVNDDTPVADNPDGAKPKPLGELPDLKEGRDMDPWTRKKAPPKPAPSIPAVEREAKAPPVESAEPSAGAEEPEPKRRQKPKEEALWLVPGDEKDFGPYPISHIKALVVGDKLSEQDELIHKDTRETMTVEAVLDSAGDILVEHTTKASAGDQLRRNLLWLAPVAVALVILVLLIPTGEDTEKEPENIIGQVKQGLRKNSLRGKVDKRDPPPYNNIVMEVMPNALMLDYRQIISYYEGRRGFEQVHQIDGYKNFDIYKDRTRRELCYRGGTHDYIYTYQADDDGYVFAIFVQGPNFATFRLDGQDPTDFSDKALVLDAAGHTTWKHKITSGIYAKVFWAKKKVVWERDGAVMKQKIASSPTKILQYIAVTSELADDVPGG